jgi:aspartate aminotransferase
MTNGNFAGLAVALRTVVDVGDEVIFVSPPWFFYETLIVAAGATPVRVYADRERSFDLDLEAIEAAITPRTRAIIVNSPHNPSGRIYGPAC